MSEERLLQVVLDEFCADALAMLDPDQARERGFGSYGALCRRCGSASAAIRGLAHEPWCLVPRAREMAGQRLLVVSLGERVAVEGER